MAVYGVRTEELNAISFRHRFARRSHQVNIPPTVIAATMGHSLERHLQLYGRFAVTEQARFYDRVNGVMADPSPIIATVPTASPASNVVCSWRDELDAAVEIGATSG